MCKKNVFVALFTVITFILGTVSAYAQEEQKEQKPADTVDHIFEAIEKHDYQMFNQHVDTKRIVSAVMEKFLCLGMLDEDANDSTQEVMLSTAKSFIKPLVPVVCDQIEQYITTGKIMGEDPTKQEEIKISDEIKNNANLKEDIKKNMTFSKLDDKSCIADIKIPGEEGKEGFLIQLKLKRLSNGHWRITEVANLEDIYKEVVEYQTKELAKTNEPIYAEINKQLSWNSVKMQVVSGEKDKKVIELAGSVELNSEKEISLAEGVAYVTDAKGAVTKIPCSFDINKATGSVDVASKHEIDKMVPEEYRIEKNPNADYSIKIKIKKLTYADASVLEVKG